MKITPFGKYIEVIETPVNAFGAPAETKLNIAGTGSIDAVEAKAFAESLAAALAYVGH